MKAVWKFPLVGTINIEMPKQAMILCVKDQDGIPVVYAEVETDNSKNTETRTIGTFYTGAKLPEAEDRVYIGTLEIESLVYHFYELLK